MSCDVGEATEGLRMSCDVGKVMAGLGMSCDVREVTERFIFQPFHYFTYITAHYPTLLLLLLHHRFFTYITWQAAHAQKAAIREIRYIDRFDINIQVVPKFDC